MRKEVRIQDLSEFYCADRYIQSLNENRFEVFYEGKKKIKKIKKTEILVS